MSRAIAEVSPMVPGILPRKRSPKGYACPALRVMSGVAEDTASTVLPSAPPFTVKSVICEEKEISRKHLAPRAGFIKFCPMPPKSCFTTMIPNTDPSTGTNIGTSGGMFMPIRSPVTAADISCTVSGRLVSFSNTYSDRTEDATDTTSTRRACHPKKYTPHILAGSSASATAPIIFCVVAPSLT